MVGEEVIRDAFTSRRAQGSKGAAMSMQQKPVASVSPHARLLLQRKVAKWSSRSAAGGRGKRLLTVLIIPFLFLLRTFPSHTLAGERA